MNIKLFLKDNKLESFRTDDFEYEMTEAFGNSLISIDRESSSKVNVKIKFRGQTITLHYSRSVFTGSVPFYYTLLDIEGYVPDFYDKIVEAVTEGKEVSPFYSEWAESTAVEVVYNPNDEDDEFLIVNYKNGTYDNVACLSEANQEELFNHLF